MHVLFADPLQPQAWTKWQNYYMHYIVKVIPRLKKMVSEV